MIWIDEMSKNSTEVVSETQKVVFIGSTTYKIGKKKSNKKLTLLT